VLHLPAHWPWVKPWLMVWNCVFGDGLPPLDEPCKKFATPAVRPGERLKVAA